MGFLNPSFEEYEKRYNWTGNGCVVYKPESEGFRYTAQDLMTYFEKNPVEALVVCNPDYPTGNYIPKEDMIALLNWTKQKGIRMILDDTFCEYADEADNNLLDHDVINEYENLIVIRSISKAHGVPGLRIGVLATADEDLILEIKKDVTIWNINSMAEFYLQICGKYRKARRAAMEQFRETRHDFIKKLCIFSVDGKKRFLRIRAPDSFDQRFDLLSRIRYIYPLIGHIPEFHPVLLFCKRYYGTINRVYITMQVSQCQTF